jgi:hypothetical protein
MADEKGGARRQSGDSPQQDAVNQANDAQSAQDEQFGQVKAPTGGEELKDALINQGDRDLHPSGEPEAGMDKTSYPGGGGEGERPPVATSRPDVPIVQSLATGAGQHQPPDPEQFDAMGRPRQD